MTRIELPDHKQVGHLTLLRQPRPITAREFNALPFAERLEIVRLAQGRQKYELILEAEDAENLVSRLAAQEVYLLVKELGAEDVPELLGLTSTDQITLFLDLDCWEGDLLREASALRWLALLLDAGEEKVCRTALEMDFELLVLVVQKFVTVTGAPGDLIDEDLVYERRLDGLYDVDYRDEESAKIVGAFLGLISRRERDLYAHLMEAVRWEPAAELEEEAYRLRGGRLLDHGFPEPVAARSVYAWLDPESFDPQGQPKVPAHAAEEGVAAPTFVLAAARPRDLLAEVLAGGLEAATVWELTYLLNKVMLADGIDVGEPAQVAAAAAEVYRYLNLALEDVSGGDLGTASALIDDCYLEHLFRLGFSLTVQLQRRARALRSSAIGPWLDGPFRALVDALCRPKPRFYEGVDEEGRAGERPFATVRDLVRAGEWLDRLEVQRRLFEERLPFTLPRPEEMALDGCLPDDPADLTLSDLLLTALANQILGREPAPSPIPLAELSLLQARICRDGALKPSVRQGARQWLDSLESGAGAFGDWCLDIWEEEFCTQRPDEIDPRYLSGLIVRVAPQAAG